MGLKEIRKTNNMVTKEAILDAANRGNWEYYGGENRCKECGRYEWENKHEKDCPVGVLLNLIENTELG